MYMVKDKNYGKEKINIRNTRLLHFIIINIFLLFITKLYVLLSKQTNEKHIIKNQVCHLLLENSLSEKTWMIYSYKLTI